MKIVGLLIFVIVVALALAFMTPDEATGDLLSFKTATQAFSGGAIMEHLTSRTPGRVFTVTANTVALSAGKVLGETSGVVGSVTGRSRSVPESIIPQSNEEKRVELIARLEDRVYALEDAQSVTQIKALQAELEGLTAELQKVQEDGGVLQTLINAPAKLISDTSKEDVCAPNNE